jgi:murein L,D-transpeptidase YcbB/YkuD
MRVQNPFDLAEVILKVEGWSRSRIDAQVQSGKRRIVKLKRKVPVYISYITAFANKDGNVHFRRDIYGRDEILAEQLLTGGRFAEADDH